MNKTLLLSLVAFLAFGLAPVTRAETRAVDLAAAFRPHGLNNVAPSATDPVAFVGSRETDTLYAFDPRTGAEVGRLEIGDGPMYVELIERPGSRLLAVSCDGFYGDPSNFVAFVDATDPAHMRVVGRAELPELHIFLFGSASVRFVDGGTAVTLVATDLETARGLLLVYDVASGAERARSPIDFVPSSLAIVESGGRTVVAVAHATAPRGRVTLLDLTDSSAPVVTARVKLPKKSAIYNINDVALAPDGRYAYVASADANALFTLDVATGRVVSRAATGSFPTFVRTFRADGRDRIAVIAENASAISFFDASTPASPSLAGVYDAPSVFLDVRPALSADGRMIYAPTTDRNRIYAVDTVTASLRYQASVGSYPTGASVWAAGDEPYVCVSASRSSDVTVFPESSSGFNAKRFATAAGAVQFTLYQNVVLAPGGDYAFVASKATNELIAIDVASAEVAGRVTVGGAPSQIAVAVDASGRRRVAVVGAESATMTVVDATDPREMTAGATIRLESPFPFLLEYANVVVSGDGRYAFVADGNQFVHAIDLTTGEIVATVGAGFNPVTLAIHEARDSRKIAVLNAAAGASSVAILDASSPEAMRAVAAVELADDLIVALNNTPRFTADGRYVLLGASISERVLSIDAERGTVAGSVESSAVAPAPFEDGDTRLFAAVNLGAEPGQIYRLKRSGAPRATRTLDSLESGFFLVGNDPVVAADGAWGYVPNYGRASLIAFDPRTGAVAGELPLGRGPGSAAVDAASGRIAAIEVNGTASRVLLADLSDLGAVAPKGPVRRAAPRRDGRSNGAATISDVSRTATPRLAAFSIENRRLVTWDRSSNRR